MSKIVIFGAGGYIGSVLTPYLCVLGHKVTAVDMNPAALRDACRYANLRIVQADCADMKMLMREVGEVEFIYWLVGMTGNREYQAMYEGNVETAIRLELANKLASTISDQTLIYPATNAGYMPNGLFATEESPYIGQTAYSKTKIEAEGFLMATAQCVSFRLAAVYGPSPTMRWETLLNHMVKHAVAKPGERYKMFQPMAVRDVIYINDLIDRLTLPLVTDLRGQVFNLTGCSLQKKEFAEHVSRLMPSFKIEFCEGADPEQRNFYAQGNKFMHAYEQATQRVLPYTNLPRGIYCTMQAARLEL